jgi:heme/copper-type cytochrome/quinol oxidase subunit 2
MDKELRITVVLIAATIIVAAALGYYFGAITAAPKAASQSVSTTTVTSTVTNSSSPFDLTLVITTNNVYNSTFGEQPAYYVLTANGLQSSADITVPAHRLIKLVIICYDNGSAAPTSNNYASVEGTQNNIETVINNDNVNSSVLPGASGISIIGGQNVSSVNASNIAHTFTIPSLSVNMPVLPSSTVSAYLMFNETGTFQWMCETECGAGATGLVGAMNTPGWMTGSFTVT